MRARPAVITPFPHLVAANISQMLQASKAQQVRQSGSETSGSETSGQPAAPRPAPLDSLPAPLDTLPALLAIRPCFSTPPRPVASHRSSPLLL